MDQLDAVAEGENRSAPGQRNEGTTIRRTLRVYCTAENYNEAKSISFKPDRKWKHMTLQIRT
jgi:hypothetical protein